jgi:hypothetical protein
MRGPCGNRLGGVPISSPGVAFERGVDQLSRNRSDKDQVVSNLDKGNRATARMSDARIPSTIPITK